MKISLDTDAKTLTVDGQEHALYTPEAFAALSEVWVNTGWALKYSYRFTWMGRPYIQLPEDVLRLQEVIYQVQPDVIIETGIAHGGGLVFYASLLAAMGKGRVIGVDIDIRAHNRQAIEAHPLFDRITLFEGSSTDPDVVAAISALVKPGERVLVVLDSDHSYAHVKAELEAYAPLVTHGSYLVATDGIMKDLSDVPGGKPDWTWDHPTGAAADWVATRDDFELETLQPTFDESPGLPELTYWPGAWLRKTG